MSDKQRFSKSGAEALRQEFSKAVAPINDALDDVQREVKTLSTWWEGGSADKFIALTNQVKDKVEASMSGWLKANAALVSEIETDKFESERRFANSMYIK